jgi:hypothetical protein
VQGRLRGEKLRVRITSECKHCARALIIEVDDDLAWKVISAEASPVLFEPDMNWDSFAGANIIHDY